MKKLILIICLLTSSTCVFSQDSLEISVTDAEVPAQFPGGKRELFSFINNRMTYVAEDSTKQVSGEMILTFIVDTSGRISNIEIKKGLSLSINSKIIDVIRAMPRWTPGRANSQWINSRYSLALVIRSHEKIAEPVFN